MSMTSRTIGSCLCVPDVQEPFPRRVMHYHYHAWPDHGIPAAASSLRRLCGVMDTAAKGRASAPVIVHCSAGESLLRCH